MCIERERDIQIYVYATPPPHVTTVWVFERGVSGVNRNVGTWKDTHMYVCMYIYIYILYIYYTYLYIYIDR